MEVEAKFQQLLIYRVRRETLGTEKLNGWLNGWLGAWGSQPKSWAWRVEYCLYSLRVLSKGSLLWGKSVSELFSENSASLRHIFSDFCGQIWWRLQNMPECVMPAVLCIAGTAWAGCGDLYGLLVFLCVHVVTFWKLVFGRFWLGVANKKSEQFELGTSTASEEQHSFKIIHTMYARSCELVYPHPKHVLSRWFSSFPRWDMDGYSLKGIRYTT